MTKQSNAGVKEEYLIPRLKLLDLHLLIVPAFLMLLNGDVGSRSSVRFWITLVVGGTRHTDSASDPKTRIQQS